jgi:hypothetical protein
MAMERVVQTSNVGVVISKLLKPLEVWTDPLIKMLTDAIQVAGAFAGGYVEILPTNDPEKMSAQFYDTYLEKTLNIVFSINTNAYQENFLLPRNPSLNTNADYLYGLCSLGFPIQRLVKVIKNTTDNRPSLYKTFYSELAQLAFSLEEHCDKGEAELLNMVGRTMLLGGLTEYDFDIELNERCLILLIKENNSPIKHVILKRYATQTIEA